MAITIQQGEILLTTFRQKAHGQVLMNTVWWLVQGVDDPLNSDLTLLNVAMQAKLYSTQAGELNNIGTRMRDLQSDSVRHEYLDLQVVYPTKFVRDTITLDLAGLISDQPLPSNTAATITRRGIQANRKNIGSFHLGGLAKQALQTGGEWSPAVVADLTDLAVSLGRTMTVYAGGPQPNNAILIPVIWNPREPQVSPRPVQFVEPRLYPRTMRRRTVGLGI